MTQVRNVIRTKRRPPLWVSAPSLLLLVSLLFAASVSAQDSVCAQVKIEIKQELTLERQAFDAEMKITNGLDTMAIEHVAVNVNFKDEAGNAVLATSDPNNTSAAFFIRVNSLGNISDISGMGVVGPASTAEIHWLIIPAPGAGGIVPTGKLYFVGATLSYTLGGEPQTMTVTPDTITVRPLPLLTLDYFLTKDVFADDPFTPAIEPAEPFTLGVRVKNTGAAVAKSVKIDSAQPKITENTQGLLIGFQITGSFVNDQPATSSLLVSLGDIAPNRASTGRWSMITTLSGQFVDFKAAFSHADALGGALTSILKETNAHLLVRDVKVDLPGRDNVRDFLAKDGDVLRVYESEIVDTVVVDQSAFANLQPVGVNGAEAQHLLTVPATAGFMYVRLADPYNGAKTLLRVSRSDGKQLAVENFWHSKTRNLNDMSWQRYVNLFDANTTGVYTLVFGTPPGESKPPVIDPIADQKTAEKLPLSFTIKASDPDGDALALTVASLPTGANFVDQGNGSGVFQWTPASGQAGEYTVTFSASDGNLKTSRTARVSVDQNQPPAAPVNLAAAAVPAGKALDLIWSAGTGGMPAARYQVLRAATAGGPYASVAETTTTTLHDKNLTNGQAYFYVVVALNVHGTPSAFSAEVKGIPADTLAPLIALHAPANAGETYVTNYQLTQVVAETEAGAAVTLYHNNATHTAQALAAVSVEHAQIDASPATRAALSLDGRYLAYEAAGKLRLYDFATGSDTAIQNSGELAFSWSRDGRLLVFTDLNAASNQQVLRAYLPASQGVRDLTTPVAHLLAGVLSPDAKFIAAVGIKDGQAGLFKIERASGAYTLLVAADSAEFDRHALRWSPDGSRLAYVRTGATRSLSVITLATGATTLLEEQLGAGAPSWSPDGSALVYTSTRDGSEQVWYYRFAADPAQAPAQALTQGPQAHGAPQWSPGGLSALYVRADGQVYRHDWLSAEAAVLMQLPNLETTTVDWGRSGYLTAKAGDKWSRYALPGRVAFNDVKLGHGDNDLSVTAQDQYGNLSAPTAAARVVYDAAAGVTATLQLSAVKLTGGLPQVATYTVTNDSDRAFTGLPLILSLIDADLPQPVHTEQVLVDLPLGGSASGSVSFATQGLPLKAYTISLQAQFPQADGSAIVLPLQSAGFKLIDPNPPLVHLLAPSADGFARGDASALVTATDDLSGVTRVEFSVDGGAGIEAPLTDPVQFLYSNLLPNLPEGTHTIVARATDGAGNIGMSDTFSFTVDNTPPAVAVAGVVAGGLYNFDVTPTVSISDAHLAASTVNVNGLPFTSGTLITAEGLYVLFAQATDLAGNKATVQLTFEIDKTPPSIVIGGVQPDGLYNTDVTPTVLVTDINLDAQSVKFTLNNQPFVSGTLVSAEGLYTLAASAADRAGNVALAALHFEIDKTAPVVTIESPVNGAVLNRGTVTITGRTEKASTVFLARGDYQAAALADAQGRFAFAEVPLLIGLNTFTLHGRDRAGNVGASVTLSVQYVPAELQGEILPAHGVLVWLPAHGRDEHCHRHGPDHHHGAKHAHDDDECHAHDPDDHTHYEGLAGLLAKAFGEAGLDYRVVHTEEEFLAALRTRAYTGLVLADLRPQDRDEDMHDLKISGHAAAEIRATVASGVGLLLIKTQSDDDDHLLDLFGARGRGSLRRLETLILNDSPLGPAGQWAIDGRGVKLKPTEGTAVGRLLPSEEAPAAVIHAYGEGRVAVLAFNPAQMPDAAAAADLLGHAVRYMLPAQPLLLPGGLIENRWTASKIAPPLPARLEQTLVAGPRFERVQDGVIDTPQGAHWIRDIITEQTAFRAIVRLPLVAGDYAASARLYKRDDAGLSLLVEKTLTITLGKDRDHLAAELMERLATLTVPREDRKRLQHALERVQEALARPQQTRADAAYAIKKLVQATEQLDKMKHPAPSVLAPLGRLLGVYQLLWAALPGSP